MNIAIADRGIRKAVCVAFLSNWFGKNGKVNRKAFSEKIGVSQSMVTRWCSSTDKAACPPEKYFPDFEEFTGYSIDFMIQTVIHSEIALELSAESKKAIQEYLQRNNLDDYRTHDSSEAHIKNLRTFTGNEYHIYYPDPGGESNPACFYVARVFEPEKTGYIALTMRQYPDESIRGSYSGTLIVPPQMRKAFIFLEKKDSDGLFVDRGMITLHYPQDKARKDKDGYRCGAGLMTSIGHNGEQSLRRVVMIKSDIRLSNGVKQAIKENLETPISSETQMIVSVELYDMHRKLYRSVCGKNNLNASKSFSGSD